MSNIVTPLVLLHYYSLLDVLIIAPADIQYGITCSSAGAMCMSDDAAIINTSAFGLRDVRMNGYVYIRFDVGD